MSTVDVIVPCYNYARFLEECVESVLSQSHGDLRVLIINDASPDNTDEVAQELLRRDSRVQYLRHPVNRGHIATYNEGLEWATGEYTLLISADDMLTPGSLARSVQLMDAHPEVVLTYGKSIVIEGGRTVSKREEIDGEESLVVSGTEFIKAACERGETGLCAPTIVVRTRVQQRIGGYFADLPHSGDTEMWLRFAAHGPIGFIRVPQAYYRFHASNMFRDFADARNIREQHAAFERFFESSGGRLPNVDELRDLARHRIAEWAFWSAYNAFDRHETEACRSFLELAIAYDPRVKTWRSHRRLRLKLLLGSRWWSRLQALSRPAAAWEGNGVYRPSCLEPLVVES